MTNLDQNEPDNFDPVEQLRSMRIAPVQDALGAMDTDASKVERTYKLAQATGASPALVFPNVDDYDRQTKAQLVSTIFNKNQFLRDYVDADPMHAKLSADDWGNLDEFTGHVANIRKATSFWTKPANKAVEGFAEGFGDNPIGSWVMTVPFLQEKRAAQAITAAGWTPAELFFRALSGGIHGATELVHSVAEEVTGNEQLARDIAGMAEMQFTGTGVHGSPTAATLPGMRERVEAMQGQRKKATEAAQAAKPWLDADTEPPAGIHPEIDKLKERMNEDGLDALEQATKVAEGTATRELNPDSIKYLTRLIDEGSMEVSGDAIAKLYGDKTPLSEDNILGWVPGIAEQVEFSRLTGEGISIPIADWLAHADGELFKTLRDDIRMRPGNITKNEAKITKEGEARLEEIYKRQEELEKEKDTLHIERDNTADEFGAESPEAAAIFDRLDLNRNEWIGLDKEAKTINGQHPPPLPEAVPSFRAAGALEPLFSVGDRKLQMERMEQKEGSRFGIADGFHDFELKDEKGTSVGYVNLSTQKGGKELYVDMISGVNGLGPRDFGPSLMRDLLRQIKEAFPEAETITGHRVSGAREKAKSWDGPSATPVIKLDNPKGWDAIEAYNEFRRVLEGGQWETYSPNTRAYIKPRPDVMDRELVNIIGEELDRIVPKKLNVQAADRIETQGAKGIGVEEGKFEPSGIYIRYREAYPMLLYSLEGPNPLGSARHEAIHHLRNYGFFKPEEWAVLEKAVMDNGWIEQFGINRRYPQGDHALKLEEAIADAYPKWERGEIGTVPPEINTLFERMKAFFTAIKDRISKLLGKDATWEDIFEKVSTGEVGSREGTKPLDARSFDEKASVREQELVLTNPTSNRGDVIDYSIQDKEGKFRGIVSVSQQDGGKRLYIENISSSDGKVDSFGTAAIREFGRQLKEQFPQAETIAGHRISGARSEPTFVEEKFSIEEPSDPSRVFQRANALGMTIEQYKRYEKLIEKRHTEDIEATTKRIGETQRRRQTKEWKDNRTKLRSEVANEINLRPDIAADNYFADGVLYGEKVERQRLGTDYLTEEQRASLPRDYYVKAGVHPDELAPLFGFPNGESLVAHLADLSQVRRDSGMRPIDFKRRVIDLETDRQMELKYGKLDENILYSVKDQVASETQLNLLAEETVYYGVKSGKEPAFDQATIKSIVADEFEKTQATTASSDRYLAASGRAGRAVENSLLKQDFEAAFRGKQQQYYSTLLARNAVEFEAQEAKFAKLAARLSQREVKAVEPEYLDFIHEIMTKAGVPIKRSLPEIESSKAHYNNEDLTSFVASKSAEGWDFAVSDAIQQGNIKPYDQMTVGEAREFMDSITSLNHIGRAVRKIEIAGEKQDWDTFRQGVLDNIKALPARTRDSQGNWFYKIDASLTRMEEIAKDLDLRKELGPLHQAVIEPMMRSKAKEFDLMTDLSKHFQSTRGDFGKEWRKSLADTIEQDILVDPYTGAAYDMTRENLIQVMLNWGNRSNIRKLVQGSAVAKWGRRLDREEFAVYEAQIKSLIDKHATAQDWQFVQRMWEPFKNWEDQMTTVSRNTSGVAPKLIEPAKVETPHGEFEGGYWPVKYDRLGSNAAVIADRKPTEDGVFGGDYFRAATAKGYLKERTGYVDFVDISTSLEQAAGTMQQTIHDIAFRDSLIQAGRVFYDKGIRAAIRKHYGSEYEAQLVPWLRRIARQFSTDDSSIAGYNDFMRRVRINLVGHALPLNLKVILSPDVGVPDPKAWTNYLSNRTENTKLAMEKSDEIRHLVYNMDRDFRESLDRITLDPTVNDFQKKAVQWGFVPIAKVSQEFRISTFVDQYQKALGRGKSEQEAALIADSFVRERHGAASVVDLPAVMQSNEGMKMLTMFYGYFNTMYNWQRQMAGNAKRSEWKEFGVNGLGSVVVGAAFGAALFNTRKQDDSWFKILGKAMLLQPLSTIPIVREAASYMFEGFQPRTPFASLLGSAGSIYTDAKKYAKGQALEKPITHVANVIGLATGLPMAQPGRSAQFLTDVARNKQRPKNIAEWARGIITGEAALKK